MRAMKIELYDIWNDVHQRHCGIEMKYIASWYLLAVKSTVAAPGSRDDARSAGLVYTTVNHYSHADTEAKCMDL